MLQCPKAVSVSLAVTGTKVKKGQESEKTKADSLIRRTNPQVFLTIVDL